MVSPIRNIFFHACKGLGANETTANDIFDNASACLKNIKRGLLNIYSDKGGSKLDRLRDTIAKVVVTFLVILPALAALTVIGVCALPPFIMGLTCSLAKKKNNLVTRVVLPIFQAIGGAFLLISAVASVAPLFAGLAIGVPSMILAACISPKGAKNPSEAS